MAKKSAGFSVLSRSWSLRSYFISNLKQQERKREKDLGFLAETNFSLGRTNYSQMNSSDAEFYQKQLRVKRQDQDQFLLLSDDLLLKIFGHIREIKTLTRCLSVSKRFALLVPFTPSASISVLDHPCIRFHDDDGDGRGALGRLLLGLALSISPSPNTVSDECGGHEWIPSGGIMVMAGGRTSAQMPLKLADCSDSIPTKSLQGFRKIETLDIDLGGDLAKVPWISGLDNRPDGLGNCLQRLASMIKWSATFGGAGFENCCILGASSLEKIEQRGEPDDLSVKMERCGESNDFWPLTKDQIQQEVRALWIKYCLRAASIMHAMLKGVMQVHPTVLDAVARDTTRKGRVRVRKEQPVYEMERNSEASQELGMKLWYTLELELPESGYVMRGVTFIVIEPSSTLDDVDGGGYAHVLEGVFHDGEQEPWLSEFVREMRKKMNLPCIRLQNVFNLRD